MLSSDLWVEQACRDADGGVMHTHTLAQCLKEERLQETGQESETYEVAGALLSHKRQVG